jgi:hypothetical protein
MPDNTGALLPLGSEGCIGETVHLGADPARVLVYARPAA